MHMVRGPAVVLQEGRELGEGRAYLALRAPWGQGSVAGYTGAPPPRGQEVEVRLAGGARFRGRVEGYVVAEGLAVLRLGHLRALGELGS